MIKINLLPQRRTKRAQGSAGGQREMAIGIGALAVAGVLVFVAFDRPKRVELGELAASNKELQKDIATKNAQLVDYPKLKAAMDDATEREHAIDKLVAAIVVPANVLHELGQILTFGQQPTMTAAMAIRTGNTRQGDPNRRFDATWDPNHVWLTSFTDTGGRFKIEGGAQAENDIAQLSKRLQASIYFSDISPSSEFRVVDRDTGTAYYNFTITGKVAY